MVPGHQMLNSEKGAGFSGKPAASSALESGTKQVLRKRICCGPHHILGRASDGQLGTFPRPSRQAFYPCQQNQNGSLLETTNQSPNNRCFLQAKFPREAPLVEAPARPGQLSLPACLWARTHLASRMPSYSDSCLMKPALGRVMLRFCFT